METTNIRQKERFNVSPMEFYKAFMNSASHSAFTGSKAQILDQPDATFTAHAGYCFGKNLALKKGAKIVQSWCAHDAKWPEGHESKITLKLKGNDEETFLEFIHENVPLEAAESIANGWIEYYWKPMKNYFSNLKSN